MCLISSRYTMFADIYEESIFQDPETGQVVRHWNLSETLSCLVVPLKTVSKMGFSAEEKWNYRLEQNVYLNIYSSKKIPTNAKVANIRNGSEVLFWEDYPGNPSTIFEVQGSNIRADGSGALIEYDTFVNRAQVQEWDNDAGGGDIG